MVSKKKVAVGVAVGIIVSGVGVTAAAQVGVWERGSGSRAASVACPGGMMRLGHPFDENISLFPGDPAVGLEDEYTVAEDFFLVEDIDTGSHAGTHIDAPGHFIEDGRTLADLNADEFIWPAYKIDVRDMELENNQLGIADIRRYEREHGRIRKGSLVVLRTGAEEFFGLDGEGDERIVDEDGNSANIDDLFDFDNKGFSGEAVQWLFDERKIDGVGSDAYGPDAAADPLFSATFTALANDGIALVALANLDELSVRKDVIMAPAVNLDGSGFSVDPLACLGRKSR